MHLMHDTCYDCGVPVGARHLDGCDIARCLVTGQQRLACGGDGGRELIRAAGFEVADREPHDCGEDAWTGEWPGVPECREFGWYAVFTDRGWERCTAEDFGAVEDLNRLAVDAYWNRAARRWVQREASHA